MATAKRLYLYLVSGVGLFLLLAGISILGGLLLDRFGLGSNAGISGQAAGQSARESLATAVGFVAVGLPLWLIHWALVERMVTGTGPAAAEERQSDLRAVYLGIVLAILGGLAAVMAADLLREAICRPLGATDPYPYYMVNLASETATLVVALGAFLYHAWIRTRDLRLGPAITGGAAWRSRLFFYGFAYVVLIAALREVGDVISTASYVAAGYPTGVQQPVVYDTSGLLVSSSPAAWWVRPLVGAAAAALVYGVAWLGHWLYSCRLAARTDAQGADERASLVRLTYFVLVVAAAAGSAIAYLGLAFGVVIRVAAGTWQGDVGDSALRQAVEPVLAVAPLVAVGLWHRRRAAREWLWLTSSTLRAIRPMDYLTALTAVTALGYSLVWLLSLLTERTGTAYPDYSYTTDYVRSQVSPIVGVIVVAAAVWLWPWLSGQRRRARDLVGEARSTSRRAYLLAVGLGTVLASASSAALIVSRLTRVGVGLDSSTLWSDVRLPVCVLAVALPILAWHAFWIWRDGAATREAIGVVASAAATTAAAATPSPAGPRELVIVGPAGVDLEPLRAALAPELPAGYSMAIRPVANPPED